MTTREIPWLIIEEEAHSLDEGRKSLASHADPRGLAQRIGVSHAPAHLQQASRIGMPAEYHALKQAYAGELSHAIFSGNLASLFEKYFAQAYALGIHSQGVGSSVYAVLKKFSPADREYIRRAVNEEVGYAKRFREKLLSGDEGGMADHRRLNMYVNGLDAFFQSGVLGTLSPDLVLYWVGPHDERKCASCVYLAAHGPYVPESLPATPRDGTTLCGANCRDSLVARPGHEGEAEHLRLRAEYDRLRHIEALHRIRINRKKNRIVHEPIEVDTEPVELPQQEPPPLSYPPKEKGKPKYDIATRQKRYFGDSVEEKPMASRLLQEETVDEGVLDVIKSFKGISSAKGMLNDLKNLGMKLDVAALYMVIGVIPHGAPRPITKAGPVTDMVRWISSAADIHERLGLGRLYWNLYGISTFRDQVEDKGLKEPIQGFHGHYYVPQVWIGDPKDEAGIAEFLMSFASSGEHKHGMELMGKEPISRRGVNITRSREEDEEKVTDILKGGSPVKGIAKWALGLESCRARTRSSLMETIRTADRRTDTTAKKSVNEGIAKILGLTAVGAAFALKGSVKTLYQAAIGLNFITLFPVIAVKPLSITDEEGNVIKKISPAIVSGSLRELIDWLNVANAVHKEFHDGRDLDYEILGLTSFRYDANQILRSTDHFITGSTGHWIDNPKDKEAIIRFITGNLAPEELYPSLRGEIIKRRIRRGEDEPRAAKETIPGDKRGRHATGKAGVYGYDSKLP